MFVHYYVINLVSNDPLIQENSIELLELMLSYLNQCDPHLEFEAVFRLRQDFQQYLQIIPYNKEIAF